MNRTYHIIRIAAATLLAGLLPASCIYDFENEPGSVSETIGINAAMVSGQRTPSALTEKSDEAFMVLFWLQEQRAALELSSEVGNEWSEPYLAKEAPQPVSFYDKSVYDTGYPYPYPTNRYLYATGYGPAGVLTPGDHYRTLTVNIPDNSTAHKPAGRNDFLGCDAWCDIYRGAQDDPFSQNKNKLFFRHLAAKLVFYVDRDDASMENVQFVRNVQVKNLRMKIGNAEWTDNDCMYTPGAFTWSLLEPDKDFTTSYLAVIAEKKQLRGNTHVTTNPTAGYKTTASMPFAGSNSTFVLQRNAIDRVPIDGMVLDSCYVCNPIVDGTVQTGLIQLKMDISAEMSFDSNFPMTDSESATDALTYTREWKDVTLNAIFEMETGEDGIAIPTKREVTEFKPGNEYRVYITFNRTGVNLVARELPWDYGNMHYIAIIGDEKTTTEQSENP